MNARDLAAYLLLAVIWGLSFVVLVRVNQAFGWAGTVSFRCLIAGLVVLAYSLLARKRLRFDRAWRHYLVIGATTVAGQLVGFTYATPIIGTAMAAVFAAAIPLFSLLMGWLWRLEAATPAKLVGLALGFVGMVLLVGFPTAESTGMFFRGCGSALLAALSAAFGSNYASVHMRGAGAAETTIVTFLLGGVFTLPLIAGVPLPGVPALPDYFYLLIIGGVMSGVAYLLYFRLVERIGATRTVSVEFLVTVIAVFVGTCILGEELSGVQLLGGAVIVTGCALVLDLGALFRSSEKRCDG